MSNNKELQGRVCKHSNYSVSKRRNGFDLTCLKVTNVFKDGTRENKLIAIENYKQPIWIVKPKYRTFKQYKDYIEEYKCREYRTPRCRIGYTAKNQLFNNPDRKATERDARSTPFVFGVDQTTCVHVKQRFFDKYQSTQETEPYTLAAYDVETCMFDPDGPIIMASVSMKKKAYFAAVRSWFPDKDDETILRKLKEAEDKWLRTHLDRRECVVEYELFDTAGQVAEANVKKFHEYNPDWVISWNARYDMEKTEEALSKENYDLDDVYSDPSIPDEYKRYYFDKGRTHKVKENGDKTSLEPQEQFPVVKGMSGWQWFDGMSAYAIKRFAAGKLEKYSLEFIAEREGVPGKLYTEEGNHMGPGSPSWHRYMQKEYPYLYCMYNICDNFAIEEIDEKSNDYSLTLPLLLGPSELNDFVSQPRMISNKLAFLCRDLKYVWGSTPASRDMTIKNNLPTLDNWIALLDTEKNAEVGKPVFEGLADVISQGRSDTSDIDVEGAYPTGGMTQNVSNKTTMLEAVQIQGADPMKFREIAINYTSSPEANAVQLSQDLFRFPGFKDMEQVFLDLVRLHGLEDELEKLKVA